MKWNKYTLKTTTAAEDIVIALMDAAGVQGVEIEDKVPLTAEEKSHMFVDIPPEVGEDDGISYLSFYLEENEEEQDILDAVSEALENLKGFMDIGEGTMEKTVTEDKDWQNNWKEFFHPFVVDDMLIKPTWEPMPEEAEGKMVVEIDPGIAFGTGKHETTQLCMKQIKKYIKPGMEVLDVGCGSGILSIVSLMCGADHVVGTDLDENCITAMKENCDGNHLSPEHYEVLLGNLIDNKEIQDKVGYEKYDLAVANILADVIIPLSKMIAPHLKKGAAFITSGIIDMKEQEVVQAFEENPAFDIVEITRQGDWVNVTAVKR